jgi:hypothetical protein
VRLVLSVLLTLALWGMACDECKPTGPRMPDTLEFSKMTVWYLEKDLTTETASAIKLHGDGKVEASLFTLQGIFPAGNDTLSADEKRKLESLFRGFWTYDFRYDPVDWDSSHTEYHIQLDHDGFRHNVMVRSPTEDEIPNGLEMIIEEMQRIWADATKDAS